MSNGIGNGPAYWAFAQRCAIATGIALLAIGLALFVWSSSDGLLIAFAATLFAVMLNGLARTVSRHTGIRRQWILVLVISLAAILIIGLLVLGAVQMGEQVPQLSKGLTQAVHQIHEKLQKLGLPANLLGFGINSGSLQKSIGLFEQTISTSVKLLTETLIILIAGVYFAVNPKLYVKTALMLVPVHRRQRLQEVMDELGLALWLWLIGRFVSMIAVGIMAVTGLSLLGVHLPFLLGLIAGTLTFVPYLGTLISLAPAVLMGLLQSPMVAFYVVVLFLGAHLLEGYVLSPLIQKKVVDIAPGWLILSQLLGGYVAGIFGIFIAAPVMVVITVIIQMLYVEDVLGEKVRLPGR